MLVVRCDVLYVQYLYVHMYIHIEGEEEAELGSYSRTATWGPLRIDVLNKHLPNSSITSPWTSDLAFAPNCLLSPIVIVARSRREPRIAEAETRGLMSSLGSGACFLLATFTLTFPCLAVGPPFVRGEIPPTWSFCAQHQSLAAVQKNPPPPSPQKKTPAMPAIITLVRPACRRLTTASLGSSSQLLRLSSSPISRTKHPQGFVTPTAADLAELRETVQSFVKHEIPESVAAQTDRENNFPAHLWPKMGDAGLLGITADESVGGLGMGYQAHCVVMEELSRASGSIGLSYAAHSQLCVNQLQLHGTKEQKEKFLPGIIAGKSVGALAMSEAGAGSDVVSMRTKAEKVNGGWELTGEKMWITNGPDADVVVVYAKSDPQRASKGITAFLVETKTSGFSVSRKLDKMGMRGSNTGELAFDRVFVPDEHVLGPVNEGVRVLMSGLDLERLVLSAGPIGLMGAALDVVLPYTHQRKQFGEPIAKNQLIQGKLADMYTKMKASKAYTYTTARTVDEEGSVDTRDCAGAILYAAERATEVTLDAIQLLGGMGYVEEMPASRIMRE